MKVVKDLIATVGEYKDANGETKKRYQKAGVLMVNDKGEQVVKINTIPINFNGWLSLYEPK